MQVVRKKVLVDLRLFTYCILHILLTVLCLVQKGTFNKTRLSSVRPQTGHITKLLHTLMRLKMKNLAAPFMLGLVGAGPGCSVCRRGQGHPLLVHSFGLRAHYEAEEVLVWYSGPSDRRRGRGTALVIQTGALADLEKGRECQFEVWLWTL